MPDDVDLGAWARAVEADRRAKDDAFKGRGSPLPAHERASFAGLAYYPVDPAHRLSVEVAPGTGSSIEVPRTDGDVAVYERAGTLEAVLPLGRVRLTLFRTGTETGGEFFLPFRDATSGTETYGAGRYLEVHPQADGRFLVDFNRAYHPFCAYNEAYSCPLPPRENWITFPVRAGERLPR